MRLNVLAGMSRTMSMMPLTNHGVTAHDGRVTPYEMSSDNRRRAEGSSLRRPAEPDTVATPLLFVGRSEPRRLTARPNRLWSRLVTRFLGPSLDHRLVRGCSPDAGLLMA